MRRKYDVEQYRGVISKLKKAFPSCAIGADIILGHPGEEVEDFNETYQLLKDLPITHFHAFPYSKRQGTTASKLPGHISGEAKRERVSLVNSLGSQKLISFSEKMVGKFNEVLFERRNKEGLFEGYTSNFVRFTVDTDEDLSNQIRKVFIEEAANGILSGKIVDGLK
jgi:threonylcarbamoyladenosine tRNA methylthiotransferase MtaB